MFKNILVPVDGSAASSGSIERAIAIAQAFKSSVTVMYVVDLYAFAGLGIDASYGQAEYLSAAKAEAEQAIAAAKKLFEGSNIALTTSVVEGQVVYQCILEAARAANADLIVMGSHGRKRLEKLVLGSVTQAVLSHTRLPVMVVRD